MPKVRKHGFEEGDIAIQINAPESDKFVRISGCSRFDGYVYHEHLGRSKARFSTGAVSVKYLKKCTQKELLIAKIKHGL